MNQLNAIIYCRVSSKGQLEGGGLHSQEIACRNYCEKNGYNILEVFTDSHTGGEIDRPGIKKLFKYIDDSIKKQKVDKFVVEDISRIARGYEIHINIDKELKRRGIKFETVSMKFEETPAGKMVEGMMAVFAEYYRNSNKQQVVSRQNSRLLDGYWTFDCPVGYKFEKAPD